ncbi:hypothetical protein [Limosilactobacillus mucosae]|uniref:3'-5' exonuclease n=1 Tax=Limosilactobacillus mucosae TaxID=97478 RepID=A0A508YUF1_LIMMU|nr:hypothetical protein [Limosilactobacillus mucosae]VTZ92297.1 hypothetical protein LMUP508_01659 [Limosilactobacillus mucosae]
MENSKTSLSELIRLERPNWQHQSQNASSAANAVTTLKQVHEIVNGPARLLSLDLEFYCDGQSQMPGTTRLGQIAGRVYGQDDAFNYYVFSSKMTPKDQLSLLKRLDLRYSEAERLTVASVLKKVLRFIDRVQPDYLVSWDNRLDLSVLNQEANRLDLSVLNQEANRLQLAETSRSWTRIQPLDLEKIISSDVFEKSSGISLARMCDLLQLQHPKPHLADHDVLMIDKILQFYALDLNKILH